MRKILYALVTILILTTLGCRETNINLDTNVLQKNTLSLENNNEAVEYDKLWNVDIGEEGFKKIDASHIISWEAENVAVHWRVTPIEYSEGLNDDFEVYESDGVTYYTKDESIYWDSYDLKEGGIKHIRRIFYNKSLYEYNLSIDADNDKSLLLPVETCVELLHNPDNGVADCNKSTEFWYVGFKKESISVHISIFTPPYSIEIYNDCSSNEEFQLIRDNDNEYYYMSNERTEDEPNHAVVYWLNDIGLIEIRAGIPYSKRNDEPRDALDFVNIQLAKNIYEQIMKTS